MAPKVTPQPPAVESDVTPDNFAIILQKLSEIQVLSKDVITLQKTLQKDYVKYQKIVIKKNAPKVPRKTPSGFAKPAKLSDDLCVFLGIDTGSELPRTEITRRLNLYIKEHNLQNSENKKQILPDEKLKTLLNISDAEQLSYFNLQKYMKHLFIPVPPSV